MPKLKKPLSGDQRARARKQLLVQMDHGEITIGQAVRIMRREWAGVSQGRLAKIVGVSANTLSAIERDEGNATWQTLSQVLSVFGMRVGILPKTSASPYQD